MAQPAPRAPAQRRQVVMIGPSPDARGGMASVIKTCLEHGYEADGRCRFIATHVDGKAWRKAARALAALSLFCSLLARRRVALLHVHVASGVSFWRKAPFIGAARLAGCPVLLHLHGGQFQQFIEQRLAGRRRRLALWLLSGSAAAFALTEDAADWLRRRARIAAVDLFPNPVGGPAPLVRQPGRDILFLGRLQESKGVFDLVRAFAMVRARAPGSRLVLAGEGGAAAVHGIMALAASLGVDQHLLLPGWVDGPERARLLSTAAVFALPSHHEQMPMSLLEAMLARVPAVASNVGCISHILNKGNCGFLVEPGEIHALAASILCILDDNISAEMTSERAWQRVRSEYLVEPVMQRLRRRYEELAA